ncbi:MAG: hypothetical protein AAFZ65_06370, partial [Planctomycetota bacterium]
LVDQASRYGVAVLAVTAVGKELVRDAKYMRLATRICAELGATYVKTYYVAEDFDTVTAACPVPIVIAGADGRPVNAKLTHGSGEAIAVDSVWGGKRRYRSRSGVVQAAYESELILAPGLHRITVESEGHLAQEVALESVAGQVAERMRVRLARDPASTGATEQS